MAVEGTKSFSEKVTFITGGASGIGRAATVAFAREYASVAIVDINQEGAEQTARLVEEFGGRALVIKCDVSREEEVKSAIEKVLQAFGRLDYAFNNAGIEGKGAKMADYPVEEWDQIINTNLRGVFLCMKYEIPQMLSKALE